MDDTYLLALPPSRQAVKLNIKLTTLNELNGVVYEVSNATTANHPGFISHVPPVTCQDVRTCAWNYRGLIRASFRPNLYTMTSITGAYVVVLTDTRVGSRNVRRLLDEAHHLNYYYREPLGFAGGVVILWDNSKVEVCGFTGHNMDMSYIVKVRTPMNHLTLGLSVSTPHMRTWKPYPAHVWRVVHVHYDGVDGGLRYHLYVLVTMLDRVIKELS
ncbi:hypothetical protein Cgig2_006547 [Carnegiea gigantea]|uniref:Uncharacterized protein n=1 Tax=Carnegiea gigantea TaxID=171969 RepID=A0A9Q1JVI6_9CARY|nr:hypothetical protein Cgig2_006547 [Carnegiea gigantea]